MSAFACVAVLALVFANGFFVAAEFSIVTVRKTRIDQLIAEGHRGARRCGARVTDPDSYIAATQLGITMASLGLGWIGEPALASMIEPALAFLPGDDRRATAHSIAVAIAFASSPRCTSCSASWRRKPIALERPEATALLVVKPTELFMKVVLAVHPAAERHGAGRRANCSACKPRRPRDGAFGRRAEDAGDREPGSRRARGARRADAPPRLRLRRSHRRPDDGAAHRAGRGRAPTRRSSESSTSSCAAATPACRSTATTSTTSSASCTSPIWSSALAAPQRTRQCRRPSRAKR